MHEYSIKESIIKNFINENNRAPTQQEIKALYNDYVTTRPNSLETGILSGHKQTFPISGDDSSYTVYNELKKNLDLDLNSILNEVKAQHHIVENNFRNYFQKMDESFKEVKRLEVVLYFILLRTSKLLFL